MLVLRLARKGRKKRPTYRVVLQEREWSPTSKAIENLGHMDPNTNPATIVLKEERITYWLEQGAQASTTVHNMLVEAGIIKASKKRAVFGKNKNADKNEEAPAPKPTTEETPAAASDAPAKEVAEEKTT